MESNPCSKIKKFKEPEGRTRYLSNKERRRLLDACKMSRNKDLLLVVELAISSGMRKNEILTIRIRQIDFDNGWINIYETKNDNKRIIPISAALLKKFQLKIDREKLVTDDLGVGAAYYEKTDGEPSLEKFMVNEAKLRVANESRGRQKNKIDEIFSRLINGE